jgi:lysophospholipase L1-like esterase
MAWSTVWLGALGEPEAPMPFVPKPRDFVDQTVRQRIRLRNGGSAVRLTLSNEYGERPLVLEEIVANGRPVLLQGEKRWSIPVGELAASDPIPVTIAAGDELEISAYAGERTGLATYLHSAQRTVDIAPGNQATSNSISDAEQTASLYWLSRAEVDQPAIGPVLIALGDSITRGDATSLDLDQRYPDHLQRRLGSDAVVLNAGIGANRLLRRQVGPSMTSRFDRDVLSVADATHVLIMAGVNDIALPFVFGEERPTATGLVDGLLTLAKKAQERGIRPILATITPFAGSAFESFTAPGNIELRRQVNAALLTQRDWPVVDFASAVADPLEPEQLATKFDSGDGVHPSDDGARALAGAVDPGLILN